MIRGEQQPMGLLQPLLRLGHQLIDRVEGLLGNARPPVKLVIGQKSQHGLSTIVPIGHAVRQHPPVFVHQHIIHAPGIYAHRGGNLSQLGAFFHARQNVRPEGLMIPAQAAVFLHRAIGKTVNFFQCQLSVFQLSKHMPSAGRADVDSQNRSIHGSSLLVDSFGLYRIFGH